MEKHQIGIIGAGNLGARHLQAMALLKEACQITVMDVSKEALKKAEAMFQATEGAKKHDVHFVSKMASMPKVLDVVVVATSSDVRRRVIEELSGHASVTYLVLEKVLFQRLEDYGAVSKLLEQKQVCAYVNCPRRMYPVYGMLKKKLEGAHTMEMLVSGSDWGLGCNGIHMLDLAAYLAGPEQIELDLSALDRAYQQGKRRGFLEITGTIRGKIGRCRALSISSYSFYGNDWTDRHSPATSLETSGRISSGTTNRTISKEQEGVPTSIIITSDTCRIHIREWKKELEFADASTGWEWQKEGFALPYQSQLTHLVIEDLLASGSCKLTPFEESCRLHLALERPLVPYFEKQGIGKGLCPIT